MADPPAGPAEASPTNTQLTTEFSVEDFQPRVTNVPTRVTRKRGRHNESYAPEESTGRVTTREVWKLIDELKDIIHRQTTLIESTKAELQEVKHEQNALQDQNQKLYEEVKALRAQLDSPLPAPSARSWAAVAASAGNADLLPHPQRPDKDQNCVRITTKHSPIEPADAESNGNQFGRYLPIPAANSHIRTALLNAPLTQDVQVAGIGTTKTGYVIRFKDLESAETARNNTEWLRELGNGTRLVKPRFGVAIHHVPTQGLDLERDKERVIRKIVEENDLQDRGFRIEDIAWLKRRDKVLGTFASMGIWFDSEEAAQWLLTRGLLINQHHIGRVEKCEIKKKRCFRCQGFGHLAWPCKEDPKCGHCGGQHERARCPPGIRAHCLDCSGEHATGDPLCPTPALAPSSQC
jgi:hypothetical protein